MASGESEHIADPARLLKDFAAAAKGAKVRITTRNPEALAAVHKLLRFQMKTTAGVTPWQYNRIRRRLADPPGH